MDDHQHCARSQYALPFDEHAIAVDDLPSAHCDRQELRVILRHDRPDQECLVDDTEWPAVVSFFDGDGGATLIADRWLLTAAHTAANIPRGHSVRIRGRAIAIARVIAHPQRVDLALVQLAAAADGIPLVRLNCAADETGQVALLLGRGDFGNGVDGVLGTDGRLRCVTNRVDAVDGTWMQLRFDRPPDCTALEGVGGEGDSGGPALLRAGGQLAIAGVSSWQEHSGPLGTYGCVEHYTRVSTQTAWIASVTGVTAEPIGAHT